MSLKIFFKAFYKGMKSFGGSIIELVNLILLIPVYLIGIGIPAVLAKIVGKKFLDKSKFDKKAKSYWINKVQKKEKIDDFYNQY